MWVTRHDYSGAETVMFGEAERLRSASKIMYSVTVQPRLSGPLWPRWISRCTGHEK